MRQNTDTPQNLNGFPALPVCRDSGNIVLAGVVAGLMM
jgi:hypothetical protein